MCRRRTFLRASGLGVAGLVAGCSNPAIPGSVTDRRVTAADGSSLAASQFYESVAVAADDPSELVVTVAADLDVNEGSERVAKCESLVLVHEDRQLAGRTPEVGRRRYRFPLADDGAYRVFGVGDFHRTNGDQMLEYEVETTLEFSLSDGAVTPGGVFYTRQRRA